MDNKNVIIILLCVIIALLVVGLALMMQTSSNDSISENSDADDSNTTSVVNEKTNNDDSPDSIAVELPEFDTKVTKTVGEYTVEAEKWMGGSVGGFEVHLYKNGEPVNKDSYLTRAYFYMDGEWKWSEWGNGEDGYEGYHRYPVSNGVEIQEVEVRF